MLDTAAAKEAIRSAVDIVDLAGAYVTLHRAGRVFKALCPWHDDSRPSLQINPERQSFKCWVCNVGGDIFSFVMRMEGVEFPEAFRILADRAGVSLGAIDSRAGGGAKEEKKPLFEALAWAERQYVAMLQTSSEAHAAKDYLLARGMTAQSIEKFRLGFAPDKWEFLGPRAGAAKIPLADLERVGVLGQRTGGGYYDRFKGRIIFPIKDSQGRTVGFGGRVLPGPQASEVAKYINSPETPLFSKSKLLYGLDQARNACSRARVALVTEGYTDCMLAHQFGFENTLAVLGTALGERHLKLLQGLVDRVILVLDGDEAGMRRANEILELFLGAKVDLHVCTLPNAQDPADFLLAHGAGAFKLAIEQAPEAFDHYLRGVLVELGPGASMHVRLTAAEKVLALLAKMPDQGVASLKQAQTIQALSTRVGIDESRMRSRLDELRSKPAPALRFAKPAPLAPHKFKDDTRPLVERWLLELLFTHPHLLPRAMMEITPAQFDSASYQALFQSLCDLEESGEEVGFAALMDMLEDEALKGIAVDLDETSSGKARVDPQAEYDELLAAFRKRSQQNELRQQRSRLATGTLTLEQQTLLLKQAMETRRRALETPVAPSPLREANAETDPEPELSPSEEVEASPPFDAAERAFDEASVEDAQGWS